MISISACVSISYGAASKSSSNINAQARLFVGGMTLNPSDVNTVIEADGLDKIKSGSQFGIEGLTKANDYLSVGVRYNKIYADSKKDNYKADFSQDNTLVTLHLHLFQNDVFKIGLFTGLGNSLASTLNVRTSSQNGTYTKKNDSNINYGLEMAVGYKKVFLLIEGGYSHNKVDEMTTSGTLTPKISTIDMSGPYVNAGILVEGLDLNLK